MNRTLIIVITLVIVCSSVLLYNSSSKVRWRVDVLALKASGQIEELTWGETLRWMLPGSPVYLDRLAVNSNPNVSLNNRRHLTPRDVREGERLFRRNCASCHGGGGDGAGGPSLRGVGSVRSDWELYRTIQRGIPGTAMPANDLPDPQIWQIMSYLASIVDSSRFTEKPALSRPVLPSEIAEANEASSNWLTYNGNYQGWRYSALREINRDNVGSLALKWIHQSDTSYNKLESNPIVVDGVMYITEPPGRVLALDATTGELIWRFDRSIPDQMAICCGVVNRGVAILGELILVATIDAHLLALDSATGVLRWEVEVAEHEKGYSITAAPIAFANQVITGVAGGESGIRGFLDAYDVTTGERIWRRYTIPMPGEDGSDSWVDESWEIGGGATWMTGTYDASLNLLYWGTGHSVHNPEVPGSDELHGSSVLAIDASTGEIKWHFQMTPNDIHGFDAVQTPVLIEGVVDGQQRKLLISANRNGYYYVLDRMTGQYLVGVPFTKVTWASGLSDKGRPIIEPAAAPTSEGTLSWPASVGATNWWPPSYSPLADSLFVSVIEAPSIFYSQPDEYVPGENYVRVIGRYPHNQPVERLVKRIDSTTGQIRWQRRFEALVGAGTMGGLLTTRGNLVFGASNENLFALDVETGDQMWTVDTGGSIFAAPMTYSVGGKQYLTIAGGRALLTFALPESREGDERNLAPGSVSGYIRQ